MGKILSRNKMKYSYSKIMFSGRARLIRITSVRISRVLL
jgi:hypothetical protein